MLPISIAGSIRIACPSTVSPASTRAHVDLAEREVAPGLDAAQVRVGLVGAGDVGVAVQRVVEQDRRRRRRPGRCSRRGPIRSANSSSCAGRNGGAERVAELDVVDAVVAADEHEPQLVLADDHRIGLDQRARGHAERARRPAATVVRPGVDLLAGASSAGGSSTGCGVGARDLDVGGVAGRQRDVVLARRAGRHVLVRAGAAHHPDVGLDPVPLQPAAVEDPVVGLAVLLVADVQARARRGRTCRSPS